MKANLLPSLAIGLASAMLLGCGSAARADSATATQSRGSSKTAGRAVAGTPTRQINADAVEITGSRLRYRAEQPGQTPAGLKVTVIDPQTAVNRGYGSPLEMLVRTPSVYRGR